MNNIPLGYKKTEIGVIPEDWEVKAIEQEIDLITGFPFPSSGYSENGIRLLRCSNVKRGVTDWSEGIVQYWSKITPELKPYILNDGDIVIAMDGSLVGKSFARLTQDDLPAILLQRVARIRSNKVDLGYLKEFVCSDYFTKYCDTVKTSSAIPHISPKDIRGFVIPLPPTRAEQTAIATALSDADALINGLEKLIAKKHKIKHGAMQKCLNPDFYDLCDEHDLKPNEKSQKSVNQKNHRSDKWEVKKLGEIAEIVGGGTPSSFISSYWNGTINWFTPTEIGKNKFTFESVRKITKEGFINCSGKMLPIGTILLTTRAGIGDLSILMSEGCTNQGFQSLIAKEGYYNEYLYYLMQTLKNVLIQNASGSTFLEISPNKIKQIEISIPSFVEQIRIATILSDMDAEIAALEAKLDKYRMMKLGMMQNLLTGKIRLV